jgi:hypothetical protein
MTTLVIIYLVISVLLGGSYLLVRWIQNGRRQRAYRHEVLNHLGPRKPVDLSPR